MAVGQDPFDDLLSLEDEFYKEGYDLGVSDGERTGLIEGRAFGLEKGFEKYIAIGRLHGKAMIWAGRLAGQKAEPGVDGENLKEKSPGVSVIENDEAGRNANTGKAPHLPANTRLEAHIRTLYALTEPSSISAMNNEDSVSEFDDRLKRAEGKAKIVEKLTGESSSDNREGDPSPNERGTTSIERSNKKGDGSIEDISSLYARH